MFKSFTNLAPNATQLHSYTAKAILFLMLMLSTNFLKAQCPVTVTLENPAFFYDSNAKENILQYDVVLALETTLAPVPNGFPISGISLKITTAPNGNSFQAATTSVQNVFQPSGGTGTAAVTGVSNGGQNTSLIIGYTAVPTAPNTTCNLNGGTSPPYKTTLFTLRLRASAYTCASFQINPNLPNAGDNYLTPAASGLGCGSSSPVKIIADFPNTGYICTANYYADIAGMAKRPQGTAGCIDTNSPNPNAPTVVGIPDVIISMTKNKYANIPPSQTTNGTGQYQFNQNALFSDYKLTASKNTNPLCGVSTSDLVLISKHILKTQPFTEWWQLIAANVNYDPNQPMQPTQPVTTADIIELRRMILGINTNFTTNTSWRFFDEKSVPTPLREEINIEPLFKDKLESNFIGVKIGDVNGSCKDCKGQFATETPDFLVRGETPLILPNFSLAQGEETLIPVRIGEDNLGLAYSVGLKLDPQKFEIMEVIPNEEFPSMGSDNFNLERTNIGEVKMLWNLEGENPVALHQGQVLFSLRVRALQGINNLEGAIQLDNTLMDNTNWTLNNEDAKRVILDFGASGRGLSKGRVTQTSIFANVSDINATTYLQFATPKRGKAELSVFNTQGKEVYHRDFDANAGNNVLEIDLSASTKSEMYYYLIQTPAEPISGRFIKISY